MDIWIIPEIRLPLRTITYRPDKEASMPYKGNKKNDPIILAHRWVGQLPDHHFRCQGVAIELSCGHTIYDFAYKGKYLRGQYKSLKVGGHHRCHECWSLEVAAHKERCFLELLTLGCHEEFYHVHSDGKDDIRTGSVEMAFAQHGCDAVMCDVVQAESNTPPWGRAIFIVRVATNQAFLDTAAIAQDIGIVTICKTDRA
jgi:hypothetical protein